MLLFKSGRDYSLPDKKKGEELTYVDKKGNIMTLKMTGPSCCRPIKKTCNKGKYCLKKEGIFYLFFFVTTEYLRKA